MPLDKSVWDKEIEAPISVIQYVDEAVQEMLPLGTKALGITPTGASYWARLGRIEAVDENGEESLFFIKIHQGDRGKQIVSGECDAMMIFRNVIPEMVAEPVGWGKYKGMEDTYFFLSHFVEMSDDIPNLADFPQMVAEMHKRGVSPDGKFGFPILLHGGMNPLPIPPCDSWEECFTNMIRTDLEKEEELHGPDEELTELKREIFDNVIPRLLRPLESNGRKVVPRLVHGDLWDGNASVDVNTGRPMIFDPLGLYAHNEFELAPWRCRRHKMQQPYIIEYLKYFPAAEPAEDFSDRNLLYNLRFDMLSSRSYPGNLRFREMGKDTMRQLVEKYSGGYDAYVNKRNAVG